MLLVGVSFAMLVGLSFTCCSTAISDGLFMTESAATFVIPPKKIGFPKVQIRHLTYISGLKNAVLCS